MLENTAYQVWKKTGVFLTTDPSTVYTAFSKAINNSLEGVVYDPSMQGTRNLSVIYSPEFRKNMIDRKGKAKPEAFSIKTILPKLLGFSVSQPVPDQFSARLVMFGPGIESTKTKLLVNKIVNARTSTFYAVEFTKGLPGGIGSGVRINYKQMYSFDLMCLYSNFVKIRETTFYMENRAARLDPALNKLLVMNNSNQLSMQPAVAQLLSGIHGIVFVVDSAVNSRERVVEEVGIMQQELMVMLEVEILFSIFLFFQ